MITVGCAKKCSSIKTTRHPTSRCNDKITNWAMNWFLIHPILRILPPQVVAITKLRIELWIDFSSILFSGFGSVWLLSVPKLKNLAVGRNSRQMKKSLSPSMSRAPISLQMTTKRKLCVLSGWNLVSRGLKSWSFEMSRHQWIVAPFHGNLPNLSNDHVYTSCHNTYNTFGKIVIIIYCFMYIFIIFLVFNKTL